MQLVENFPEVPPEKLYRRCDPDQLDFQTTDDLQPCEEIIGQNRAIKAIHLGLDIESPGYNIFVTGYVGTGRNTTIKGILEEMSKTRDIPEDKCYVNNFRDSDMPRTITLPAGKGREFRKDMSELITSLKRNIPLIFESESYQQQSKRIIEEQRQQEQALVKEFEKKAGGKNFTMVQLQMGPYIKPDIMPMIMNKPVPMDQLETLAVQEKISHQEIEAAKAAYSELSSELEQVFKETRKIEKKIREDLSELSRRVILPLLEDGISEIREKYDNNKINQYLEELKENLIDNIKLFLETEPKPDLPGQPAQIRPEKVDDFPEYHVNLLVDNSELQSAPVIVENTPTYHNLFGAIEKIMDRTGRWTTDFTRIKAGSLLKADGGYLVLNATDVLTEPGVWIALKRVLKTRSLSIQSYDPMFMFTTSALKPEPIGVNVKVVLVGNDYIYHLLQEYDEDLSKIFKVKADFDSVMELNEDSVCQYGTFVKKICQEEKLLPFDKNGVAAVIEYGVRLAGRQNKLSTRFNALMDLIHEADYWAKQGGSKLTTDEHVNKAIEEKIARVGMVRDKLQELIRQGTIMIDTEGSKVGQVNGLAVYDMKDFSFGKPSRITAEVSMGRAGIINIEREADLSGKTHNKGMLILSGYLRGKYAQEQPLTISASICFEQSYSGVDGDSASSTELYALLSAISELPLRQDTAITGSVNQKGEIQPIGGVNQKIEGFYDVCKVEGLTGKQGVMIPHLNIEDLMLRKDVVEAVKNKEFHIYPVKTIGEGIQILTGVKAGEKTPEGAYEENTVNFMVDKHLRDLAEKMKSFAGGGKEQE